MTEATKNRTFKSFLPAVRDVAILWLVSKKPRHGYDVIREFKEFAPPGLSVTESRVYPGLNDLERRGYLRSEMDTTVSEERPRKVYSITKKGRDYLNREAASIHEMAKCVDEFLTRMMADMSQSDNSDQK